MITRRVCVLRHNFYPTDVRVRREVNALVASGVDVDIICLRMPGQRWKERLNGATVYRVPMEHHRSDSPLRYLYQYVASFVFIAVMVSALQVLRRYDIVQVNTMPDFLIFAALAPRVAGARLVLDIQDLMPEITMAKFGLTEKHPLVQLVTIQEGMSMWFAHEVITVIDEFRDRLVQRHRGKDVAVIMNCPDETILPRRLPALAPRPNQGAPDRPFILLSHGVLLERLGYDTAIRAVALLEGRIPNLQLQIVGPGEYGRVLKELADRLGVSERVHFVGSVPQDNVPELVARADLGIVANKNDGCADLMLPTKLLEYVWMGKPTVAARTSTITHYFDDNMVEFFEPDNPADLAERIWRLYRAPEARQQLALNACRFFDTYDWAKESRRYCHLVDRLFVTPTYRERLGSAIASRLGKRVRGTWT